MLYLYNYIFVCIYVISIYNYIFVCIYVISIASYTAGPNWLHFLTQPTGIPGEHIKNNKIFFFKINFFLTFFFKIRFF